MTCFHHDPLPLVCRIALGKVIFPHVHVPPRILISRHDSNTPTCFAVRSSDSSPLYEEISPFNKGSEAMCKEAAAPSSASAQITPLSVRRSWFSIGIAGVRTYLWTDQISGFIIIRFRSGLSDQGASRFTRTLFLCAVRRRLVITPRMPCFVAQ